MIFNNYAIIAESYSKLSSRPFPPDSLLAALPHSSCHTNYNIMSEQVQREFFVYFLVRFEFYIPPSARQSRCGPTIIFI